MRHRGKWSVMSDGSTWRPLWIVMSPEGRVVWVLRDWANAVRIAHREATR